MAGNNPILEPASPYFLPSNENPGAFMVSSIYSGNNYHAWSRAMKMALCSKNKVQFIDGTLPRPPAGNPLRSSWDRCNTLVLSWITHSLDPTIAQSVLWMDTALEVWNDLKERYYQGDVFRISELQEQLFALKQGDMSITAYFTQLKSLWGELENFRPIPLCTCAVACRCELVPTIKKYRQCDYVIRFLEGLNKEYSAVRSQIMLIDPLPSINRVFSMLIEQERQICSITDESKFLANAVESNFHTSRGRGKGRGGQIQSSRSYEARGNNVKMCSYGGKSGHTVDTCYPKHGNPPNMRGRNTNAVNNVMIHESYDDEDPNHYQQEGLEESRLSFTAEQHKALLALLQRSEGSASGNHHVHQSKINGF